MSNNWRHWTPRKDFFLKDTPNSWCIPTDPYDRTRTKRNKYKRNPGSTFHIFLCPKCSRVHEHVFFNGLGKETIFHDDFPTYKLERTSCVECDGESLGGNSETSSGRK